MIKNVRFTDINFIIVLIMLFCCPIDILAQKSLEILIDSMDNGNTVQSVLAEGELIEMLA